jgi:hypothetical protein
MITELLCRSGCPTEESLSPYAGFLPEVKRQVPDFSAHTLELFDTADEFDPARAGLIAKRLEDIPEEAVRRYALMAVIGMKIHARGGIREFDTYEETRTVEGEDGESVNETELQTDGEDDYTPLEIISARGRLPIVLLRLFRASEYCGVNLITLIFAFVKCGCDALPSDLIRAGFYFWNGCKVLPGENKREKVHNAIDTVRGAYPHSKAYKAMFELLEISEKLEVDLRAENPLKYTTELYGRLKEKLVAEARVRGDFPVNITDGVILGELAAPERKPAMQLSYTPINRYLSVTKFRNGEFANHPDPNPYELKLTERFLAEHNRRFGTAYSLSELHTSDLFLYDYNEGAHVLFGVRGACRLNGITAAYVNVNGFALAHSDAGVFVQRLDVLLNYWADKNRTGVYRNNTLHGHWEKL